jgi:hypothetical protein
MTGEVVPAGNAGGEDHTGQQLRASHEDREQVAEQLRVAAGDGRIDADELDHRLEIALTARTYGELAALTADLPGAMAAAPAAPIARAARQSVRIDIGSATLKREGHWEVPQHLDIRIGSGTVVLDFTQVTVPHSRVDIDADVRSGSLVIVTLPGVTVDAGEVSIRSGSVKSRSWPGPPVPTTLLIQVTGQVASGNITARPPRRSFWQWLLRRPLILPRALER